MEVLICTCKFLYSTTLTFSLLDSVKLSARHSKLMAIDCGNQSLDDEPTASGNGIQLTKAFARQEFEKVFSSGENQVSSKPFNAHLTSFFYFRMDLRSKKKQEPVSK